MQQLRIPGPTPCPPEILKAIGRQMINHRGKEFDEIIRDITDNLIKFLAAVIYHLPTYSF